jgi:hypothetical protein
MERSAEKTRSLPVVKPPMNLPNINSITGHFKDEFPPIRDQLSNKTMNESISYWRAVEHRKLLYRIERALDYSPLKKASVLDSSRDLHVSGVAGGLDAE